MTPPAARWLALGEVPPDLARPAVWLARNDDPAWAGLVAGLRPSAADLADAALFTSPARAAARLARRMLLKALAGRTLGCAAEAVVVERAAAGAIRVSAPEPLFASLSARDGWTAVALARTAVGVDIEAADPSASLPLNVLTASEARVLAGLDEAERPAAFARYWVVKEAALKAMGLGLNLDPAEVEVRFEGAVARVWRGGDEVAAAEVRDGGPGVMAVAG